MQSYKYFHIGSKWRSEGAFLSSSFLHKSYIKLHAHDDDNDTMYKSEGGDLMVCLCDDDCDHYHHNHDDEEDCD